MNLLVRITQIFSVLRLTPFDTSTEDGRSKERYRLIALSSSSSLVTKLATSLIGLVTVPLTINYLGKELFGLWMVISSLVVWMQLADFGIINGLANALSEAHGRDDKIAACGYFTSALVATLVTSILCLLPMVLLALWLPWGSILKLQDPSLVQLASDCFLVAGLVFVVSLPVSVVNKVFIAYQLGYVANLIQIITSFLALVGVLLAIKLRLSLPWLVFLVSVGPVLGNLASWFILYRLLPWCHLEWQLINRSALHRVAHSSIPLFVFQVGALLVNQMVNVVIARVGTLTMVSDYNILLKIYMLIFTVGVSFSAPFYPAIREAYEKNERGWVFRSIRRVIAVRLGVLFLPGIILLLVGDRLIQLWIHQPISGEFGLFGWASFMICMLMSASSSTLGEILTSLDDIWSQIKIVFLSAFIVIVFMYVFIPKIGLMAIYLAFSISSIYPIYWGYRKLRRKFFEAGIGST